MPPRPTIARRRVLVTALSTVCLVAASCGSDASTAPTTTAPPATTQTDPPATTAAATTTSPTTTDPDTTEPDTTDTAATTDPDTTGSTPTSDSAPPTTQDPTAEAFQWDRMGVGPIEEGFLDVPLDYDEPTGEQISLYVVRHRAGDQENKIGSLLVNPGGPGFGGTVLALNAEQIYGEALLENFDIIGWDPRGTGESEPVVDCVDDYDPYVGIETGPDTPEEEQAVREAAATFAAGCEERSGELLDHIATADSARDMDAIRAALQEEQISYFGWSYGTQLGATWATLFPGTVRAAVLDGSIDPTTGRVGGLVTQTAGFDRTLSSFLADCSADPECAFHNGGDAEGAFAALIESLDADPIPTEEGRPPLVDGVFELGVAQALYAEELWPDLAAALAAAQQGDGSGILSLYDQYYGRGADGTYGNELEAYFAITCADDPPAAGPGAAVDEAVAARAEFAAQSRIPYTQAYELVICASMPQFDTEKVEITGAGAGPIMVVGNTGDPATPYEGSRVMAETLEAGFFVSVESNTHTAYSINACAAEAIEAYLVDLEVPDAELTCPAE
jgi:pimeloyl-ACP methyl ester carboxylesterase